MNFDEMLFKYFKKEQLDKIKNTKVVIAGCGGLGSNVAVSLVRSGFCHLYLIDHDYVEISNLNRQAYFYDQIGLPKVIALKENLLRINKDINVLTFQEFINRENVYKLLSHGDIIVEAVDDKETKLLLLETAHMLNKKIVMANGVCGFGDVEKISIKRFKNTTIIGDFESDNSTIPPYAPKVSVVANMQCDEVLRIVLKDSNY
ncbi:MAG: thiamine biosynthesis protein ThiF [Dictyoglomus sp. NZ13-RE01]|nr:MAG: thiamine biosynthesis protein ThiF [Dictyoglomus sp. NZ13-RE01]